MLRQNKGILIRLCLYCAGRGRDDIRDMYQEIACALWEAWSGFRGDSSASTWITSVALRVVGQEVRKRKRMPQFVVLDERFYDMAAVEADSPYSQRLYRLIEKLDDSYDRALVYLYLDRMPYQQIAMMTGTTEDNVRQRLHRIKDKLIILKNSEDEEDIED